MSNRSNSENASEISKETLSKRNAANFSLRHKLIRVLFRLIWLLFAQWTPPQFGRWRLMLLRIFGARIHPSASVRGGAKIWYPPNLEMAAGSVLADGVECYNMAHIYVGEGAIVSQRAFLCGGTHDYRLATNPLITRPIEIGPHAWVCAEAFVSPGSVVSEGCVVGARAVISGVLAPWSVYAGNPARKVKTRDFDPNN